MTLMFLKVLVSLTSADQNLNQINCKYFNDCVYFTKMITKLPYLLYNFFYSYNLTALINVQIFNDRLGA